MVCPLHALLRSSIVRRNTRLKQSSMPGGRGEDVSCNISCTGRATHTPMTHGLRTKTSTPQNSLPSSCIPTLLWLDDQQYKGMTLVVSNPHLLPISRHLKNLPPQLLSVHLLWKMSRPSTPIYVSSRDSTPSPSSSSDTKNASMMHQI